MPIPLGSVVPAAWAGMAIAVYALLFAWLVLWAGGRVTVPAGLSAARVALGLLALWIVEQALHVVPLPWSWVGLVSGETARIHALSGAAGPSSGTVTLSVDPYASQASLLKTLAYSGVFFLVLALANSRGRVRLLAAVVVYTAVAHSVYAVLMHLSGAQTDYLYARIAHGAQASGFFVNRNHFAGYLEMALAVGIGLLIAGLSDRRAESWKHFFRDTLEWVLSPKMVLRLSLCVLVIALTTTHSRMGNIAFFSSLLVAGVIGVALSRHATRNAVILLASLVVIDLLIVGSWFGVERLVQRIEQTTTQEVVARETPAAHTLAMIERSPVFGVGPGTFYVAFEPYRPEAVVDYFDFTHNDYAQFAAESGLLGIALIGGFVVLSLVAALRAQWVRRDPLKRGMSFACIMGVTAILIHSSADFNLQIPANAAYFMLLLALGWISLGHHGIRGGGGEGVRLHPAARWLAVAAIGCVLAWASLQAWQAAWASTHWIEAKRRILDWRGGVTPPLGEWSAVRDRLQAARALEPDNPRIHELMGLLAARRFDDPRMLSQASSHYLESLALRPVSPVTWANLAEARYLVGDTSRIFEVALVNAARLGPAEPQTQRVVAHYGLATFDELGAEARRATEALVAAGMRRDPAEMLAIAQRRGRLDVACRYLGETRRAVDPRWERLCAAAADRG